MFDVFKLSAQIIDIHILWKTYVFDNKFYVYALRLKGTSDILALYLLLQLILKSSVNE